MKTRLTFLLLLVSMTARPCGYDPRDYFYFYEIFNQKMVSASQYHPFLRSDNFYYVDDETQDGNLALWQEILPEWTKEELTKALSTMGDYSYDGLWKTKLGSSLKEVYIYMRYARKCSSKHNTSKYYPTWDYKSILRQGEPIERNIIYEGVRLFADETNEQLKLRYTYQLIRLYHYSKQYQEAIDFFNNQVKGQYPKNEIYYYIMDQVAGCYFSLGEYETSAYMFLQVFSQSIDRKKSAFLSYRFCVRNGALGKTLLSNKEDSITFTTLKYLSEFSDNLTALEELSRLAPNDVRAELFAARAINNIERKAWTSGLGFRNETLPNNIEKYGHRIDKFDKIISRILHAKGLANTNFWVTCKSYLSFLKGNTEQAQQILAQTKSKELHHEKLILGVLYEVFTWTDVGMDEEKYLAQNLTFKKDEYSIEFSNWEALIIDRVAHLYYKNGKLAKSFLCNNNLSNVDKSSSKELIDDLLAFMSKPNKNRFEKTLIQIANSENKVHSPKEYVSFVKGMFLLREGNFKLAYPYLKAASTVNYFAVDRNKKNVSAKIFSNNIFDCFMCSADKVMTDSVYLASLFSFIEPEFSMCDLAANLIKLDSLCGDPQKWKRKLAYYLLGNYYLNVSGSGYYRGLLSGRINYSYRGYFEDEWDRQSGFEKDFIRARAGYNLEDISTHYSENFGLAQIAYENYKKAILLSEDKELNARCLFMMEKCQLNKLFNLNMSIHSYRGEINSETKPYKRSFETLKNNYSDTRFFDMIIKECSFFRIYCSL